MQRGMKEYLISPPQRHTLHMNELNPEVITAISSLLSDKGEKGEGQVALDSTRIPIKKTIIGRPNFQKLQSYW